MTALPGTACRRRSTKRHRIGLAATLLLSTFVGCDRTDEQNASGVEATPAAAPTPYAVPTRTDAELATDLAAACESARGKMNRRVLVEFSAEWCGDCRKLHGMKQEAALARELERWSVITVNVGRFDRHRDVLDGLGVESIAHWSVFEASRCDAPIVEWPRRSAVTLEVSSGDAKDLSPEDLARWLAGQRSA